MTYSAASQSWHENFLQLGQCLKNSQHLWQGKPFIQEQASWQQKHPELYQALLQLEEEQLEVLADNDEALQSWFSQHLAPITNTLGQLKFLKNDTQALQAPAKDNAGVPGRKWQQITQFCQALPELHHPVVDWCAGKGHLSRAIQQSKQQTVLALERDSTLCTAGEQLANKHGSEVAFLALDIMKELPESLLRTDLCHTALHACGQLHIRLLEACSEAQAKTIAIAPCCHHKISGTHYQALSKIGRKQALMLTKNDLQLTQEHTVTAGKRVRTLRNTEQLWRLGFDELQKHIGYSANYLALPSINKAIFSKDFQHFCQWAAEHHKITLPTTLDYPHFLAIAENRLQRARRLELLRKLFRRPLEHWLILDKSIFLQEKGYRVEVSQFCESQLSPRNLLIFAQHD